MQGVGVVVGVRVLVGTDVCVGTDDVGVGVISTTSVEVGLGGAGLVAVAVAAGCVLVGNAVLVGILVDVAVAVGTGVEVAGRGPLGAYRFSCGTISLLMLGLSQRSCALALPVSSKYSIWIGTSGQPAGRLIFPLHSVAGWSCHRFTISCPFTHSLTPSSVRA